MPFWKNLSRGLGYLINPLGIVVDYINGKNGNPNEPGEQAEYERNLSDKIDTGVSKIWDDLTGKSNIELQNEYNRQMVEEEYQRNLQSIGDTAAAYEAAGFNRNIMYGGANGSPVGYSAPQLQAYSGSKKLDTILQRTGKVLSMIPAMYQASAALEGIDQARERTKQSEIKTMSMGMSLLDQGYRLGDIALARPWQPSIYPFRFGDKRHVKELDRTTIGINTYGFDPAVFSRYADAALKNKFDLLESIGIKNQMNSTLNNWRGYQYSLDRRFGAAGRIVGIGAQGLGAVGKLFSPIKLFGK